MGGGVPKWLRERSAKPPRIGSNPIAASKLRNSPDLFLSAGHDVQASFDADFARTLPLAKIPNTVAAEVARIEPLALSLGWTREQLWDREFRPTGRNPRGLASMIAPGRSAARCIERVHYDRKARWQAAAIRETVAGAGR